MSNKEVVKLPRKFDQDELETKQAEARNAILTGVYKYHEQSGHGSWVFPAIESFSFTGFEQVAEFIHSMALQGRELSTIEKPFSEGFYYKVSYLKSKEELDILFAESDAQVAAEYTKEIDDFNQTQIDLLTQQLYNQAKAKEEKILADKEAKTLVAAKAEAEKFIKTQLEGAK